MTNKNFQYFHTIKFDQQQIACCRLLVAEQPRKNKKIMRNFIKTLFITATSFMPLISVAMDASTSAPDSSLYVDGSLCKKPDQIVFSCPLDKSKKIVSICAAGNAVPHRFYYAFGKTRAIEMTYPSKSSDSKDIFARSFLGYAGGTGGYAYSFLNKEIKYIVYLVSGKFGFNAGGVMIQRSGDIHATADMKCAKGRIKEYSSDSLLDETLKWKSDDDLNARVLPSMN